MSDTREAVTTVNRASHADAVGFAIRCTILHRQTHRNPWYPPWRVRRRDLGWGPRWYVYGPSGVIPSDETLLARRQGRPDPGSPSPQEEPTPAHWPINRTPVG